MLTIFSTPKPFLGHINIIQRNAIESWKRLHPSCEVILFGADEGAAETARELDIRHEAQVERNEFGTKYLASIFDRAEETARHGLLCYVNCDIVLTGDFIDAVKRVSAWRSKFLMAGQRWDLDVAEPLDFGDADWGKRIQDAALAANRQRPPQWIDYFVFSRGLYRQRIPSLVVGRPGWDNWLVWRALADGAAVVDASESVTAVHQNHDYGYHPDGEKGVWEGQEAQRNYQFLEGRKRFRTVEDATHVVTPAGIRRNFRRYWVGPKRRAVAISRAAWFGMLGLTRPLRHRLGWRQKPISPTEDSAASLQR